VRREIAGVRLLTLHLTGVELVPPGKVIGSCPCGVFDLFINSSRRSLNGPDWGEADLA
jgi:hypothetical protein